MFDRNSLRNLVFWPQKGALLRLITDSGEVVAETPINEITRGDLLARSVPENFEIETKNCGVATIAGKLVYKTKVPFDTSVITERPEITFEERMARLERREMRREKREQQREAAHLAEMDAMQAALDEARDEIDVIDDAELALEGEEDVREESSE